jgi:hypothetical protein
MGPSLTRNQLSKMLARFEQELAVGLERFSRVAKQKHLFVMDLQGHRTITLEDRQRFLELMRAEQVAYREYHAVQVRVQDFLRQNVG